MIDISILAKSNMDRKKYQFTTNMKNQYDLMPVLMDSTGLRHNSTGYDEVYADDKDASGGAVV
jgi:hypothetical protein